MLPSPLMLVGFMGCGKSTVGRRLAQRLGWYFHDLDERIEAAAGAAIATIFARQGEAAFRLLERAQLEQALALAATDHHMVVALGGGTFAQPGLADRILASPACTVFLDVPLPVLLMRCAQMTNRPLFRDEASFRELHAQRLPYYRRAHVVLQAGDEPPDLVVDRILALWNGPMAEPGAPALARELGR